MNSRHYNADSPIGKLRIIPDFLPSPENLVFKDKDTKATPSLNRIRDQTMPIISMFYGIIIRLFLIDNKHHNLPHIHAKYAEFEASINIKDGEILSGDLPRKQLRLVQAWIELHRDELTADWELAVSGESPYKIAPL
jgi:hypothetical protein